MTTNNSEPGPVIPSMISIVDYGMGNLRSVEKALEKLGCATQFVTTAEAIDAADSVILPGVGAFGDAMAELRRHGLVEPLQRYASSGKPMLGICLGMQVLFESSDEAPDVQGLGVLAGRVCRMAPHDGLKIPHMGWSGLTVKPGSRLLESVENGTHVYFVHSYHVCPAEESVIAAECWHGCRVVAAVERGALWGTQFHPEKSQAAGLAILANFAKVAGGVSSLTSP